MQHNTRKNGANCEINRALPTIANPRGVLAAQIGKVGGDSVCTSIIVAAERRYGAVKSTSSKLAARVDLILSAIEILPLEVPADRE